MFQPLGAIVSKQSLQIVAIGPVTAEGVLIEQAFDTARGADLVGASLRTDGPTHLAVPAATEQNGGAGHTGGEQSHGPQPTGALRFFGARFLVLFLIHNQPAKKPTATKNKLIRAPEQCWCRRKLWMDAGFRIAEASSAETFLGISAGIDVEVCRLAVLPIWEAGKRKNPRLGVYGDFRVFRTLQPIEKPGNLPVMPGGGRVKPEMAGPSVMGKTAH